MKFKNMLKKAHLTQAQVAKAIGKSQRLISSWCTGICQPQIEMLPKLALILKAPVEEIIDCFTSGV